MQSDSIINHWFIMVHVCLWLYCIVTCIVDFSTKYNCLHLHQPLLPSSRSISARIWPSSSTRWCYPIVRQIRTRTAVHMKIQGIYWKINTKYVNLSIICKFSRGSPWSWSLGNWIYNYLWNQCLFSSLIKDLYSKILGLISNNWPTIIKYYNPLFIIYFLIFWFYFYVIIFFAYN